MGEAVGCEDPTLETTGDSCELSKLCGRRTEVDAEAGIFVLRDPREYAVVCNGFDDPLLSCSCVRPDWESLLEVTTSSLAAACQTADAVCFGDAPLEPSGPVECDAPDVTIGPGCTSFAYCRQAVPIDEGTVFFEGGIAAECAPTGTAGEWECACQSNIYSTARFIQTSSDAPAVCLETQSLCETLVNGVGFDSLGYPSFKFGPLTDAGAP
jgi:hypothetical protein